MCVCVCVCVCVQPQMIVDLAHVPLTQRRADMPLNKLSESPLPEDAIELQMPETATPDPSTDGNVSVNVLTSSPNHLPNDASVSDNLEDELQWNITTKDSEVDSNRDNADDTTDKPDQSIPKPSASHNLPKLIIPEPDEKSIRNRRSVVKCSVVNQASDVIVCFRLWSHFW